MHIGVGCELTFDLPQTTPMLACPNVHFSRFSRLERPDYLPTNPAAPVEGYRNSALKALGWRNRPGISRLLPCYRQRAGLYTAIEFGQITRLLDLGVAGRTLNLSPKIDEASFGNATRSHASYTYSYEKECP